MRGRRQACALLGVLDVVCGVARPRVLPVAVTASQSLPVSSSTRYVTPSCRRAGSRISGDRTRGPATPPKHHQTFAALAEKDRRLISQRTRDAVAAKKAQGKQLGNPKLVAAATKRDKVLRPILPKLAGQSLRAITAELDRRGIKSWSGKPWNAVSVRNAMVRLGFQTTGGA